MPRRNRGDNPYVFVKVKKDNFTVIQSQRYADMLVEDILCECAKKYELNDLIEEENQRKYFYLLIRYSYNISHCDLKLIFKSKELQSDGIDCDVTVSPGFSQ